MQILDKTGNVLISRKYPAGTKDVTINVSKLKPDMYITRIIDGKHIEHKKLIVDR